MASSQESELAESTTGTRLVKVDSAADPEKQTSISSHDSAQQSDEPAVVNISAVKSSRASAWPTGEFSLEPSPEPTEGAIIKNRFVLEKLIASGGMGMVFKARDG